MAFHISHYIIENMVKMLAAQNLFATFDRI